MKGRIALCVLFVCLVAPGVASAAYVRFFSDMGYTSIQYEEGLPAQNDLTVSQEGRTVTFHDGSDTLQGVHELCEKLDDHTARCTAPEGTTVHTTVLTGAGDDRVVNLGASGLIISGGGGRDTLSTAVGGSIVDGGGGDDVLIGSPGDDTLVGGPGSDQVFGRAGNDRLGGDDFWEWKPRSDDVIHGGPGLDTAFYKYRIGAVHVDLRRTGGQGVGDERDVLTGIEGVETGRGADRVVAPKSVVHCGARVDEVVQPDPGAIVGHDCDRTRVGRSLVALTRRWHHRDDVFSLPLLSRQRCRASVDLFDGSSRLGGTRVRLQPGKEGAARVPVSFDGPVRVEVRGCGPLLAFSLRF